MAIQTKDEAQGKADRRLDRTLRDRREKREVPLEERKFEDLMTLKDQLAWMEIKRKIKLKSDANRV